MPWTWRPWMEESRVATMSHARAEAARVRGPLVPLAVIDAPTQRFYAAAAFIAVQVWKYTQLVQGWLGSRPGGWAPLNFSLFHALLIDFAVVYVLHRLAIPVRMVPAPAPAGAGAGAGAPRAVHTSERTRPLTARDLGALFALLVLLDVLIAGDGTYLAYSVTYAGTAVLQLGARLGVPVPGTLLPLLGWSLSERRVRVQDVVHPAAHISGQHTVHLRPYGTAYLAPMNACVCLQRGAVEIPVVFNGTVPHSLHYAVTDPATGAEAVYHVSRPRTQAYTPQHAYLRGADEPDVPPKAHRHSLRERLHERTHKHHSAQNDETALVHYLRIGHIGTVRLVSVADAHHAQARIEGEPFHVVPCPRASFVGGPADYCPGADASMRVAVSGVPPLALEYASDGVPSSVSPIVPREALPGTPDSMTLDLSLDLTAPGVREYALRAVRDACGNRMPLHESRRIAVHARAQAQFDSAQCSADSPIKLVRGRGGVDLRIALTQEDGGSDEWAVRVDYAPDMQAALSPQLTPADAWEKTVSVRAGQPSALRIERPGTYTLAHVGGRCAGSVGAPWTCQVVDVPPPSASITFESIEDPCAGTVGVKALSVLHGEPPFNLMYEVRQQGEPARRQLRVVRDQTRDELELWPSTEGRVTYRFVGLSDANYNDVRLDGPSFTAVVHPLAGAAFVGADGRDAAAVTACRSSRAEAQVELSGTGPWDLTYAVRHGAHVAEHTVQGITTPRYVLRVPLPESPAERGAATISLLGIRDGKGCTRRLATRDLRIDLARSHATVGFLPSDAGERRALTMLDGTSVRLPIRLSGDGPWRVRFAYENGSERDVHTAIVRDANAALTVSDPGMYTLLELEDAHCPGSVLPLQDTYRVNLRERPQAAFAGTPVANGSVLRAPVCAGTQDSALVTLSGAAPISVAYTHSRGGRAPQHNTFRASQAQIPLALDTAPGWHTYEIAAVGDAVYTLDRPSGVRALRLEQHVWSRAGATFDRAARPTFCRGDTLGPLPVLRLTGTPPFTLRFALTRISAPGAPQIFERRTTTHEYVVDAKEVALDASGAYELVIERISDAHGCASSIPDTPLRIDVVETAGIVPSSARRDYCVGEQIDFVLQGTSPWTVHYSFGGKHVRLTARTPEFSRIAERPGVLVVHSAAHQLNQCRSKRAPTESVVHALPSAHVSGGRNVIESLHQGDAAEIVFRLSGEPPFAFTYQRTEAVDTHAAPRVLETHTVEGISEPTYTIRTSEEGTWSVVWMQDRWCQVSLGQLSGPASWAQ